MVQTSFSELRLYLSLRKRSRKDSSPIQQSYTGKNSNALSMLCYAAIEQQSYDVFVVEKRQSLLIAALESPGKTG